MTRYAPRYIPQYIRVRRIRRRKHLFGRVFPWLFLAACAALALVEVTR